MAARGLCSRQCVGRPSAVFHQTVTIRASWKNRASAPAPGVVAECLGPLAAPEFAVVRPTASDSSIYLVASGRTSGCLWHALVSVLLPASCPTWYSGTRALVLSCSQVNARPHTAGPHPHQPAPCKKNKKKLSSVRPLCQDRLVCRSSQLKPHLS